MNTQAYVPINRACTSMNLSAPQITGDELRSILKCFNAYGALDPIQKLFDKLSGDRLDAFVQMGNQHILGDTKFLYDLEQTVQDGRNSGALDDSMRSVALLLKNPELISSALAIMDSGGEKLNQKTIGILQTLAAHLDAPSVGDEIELGMNISGSSAFASVQNKLRSDKPGLLDAASFANTYYKLLQEAQQPGGSSALDELNRNVNSGDFYKVMDALLGSGSEKIAQNVPFLSPLFPELSRDDGKDLRGLAEIFTALQSPIKCLNGTKQAPDVVMHMFAEFSRTPDGGGADFLTRTHLLDLVAVGPFCDFPAAVQKNYADLVDYANSSAGYGSERVAKAAFANRHDDGTRPIVETIRKFFLDPKTIDTLPIFQELSTRETWSDIILLLALPSDGDRARLGSFLSFLADPSPSLGGGSVKDALTDLMVAGGPAKILSLVQALKDYVNQDEALVYPALTGFRNAYSSNDAHPYIDFTRKLLADAPRQRMFFKTLFAEASSPEFKASLKLVSDMARDGRLKDMLSDLLTILHGSALRGQHPVHAGAAQPFHPARRHDLSAADLKAVARPPVASGDSACLALAPTTNLIDLDPGSLKSNWDLFLNCLTAKGDFTDVKGAIDYLRGQSTESGESDLALLINVLSSAGKDFSQEGLGYLGDVWERTEDDGSFGRALEGVAALVSQKVVQPLLSLAAPVMKRRSDLELVENYAGKALQSPDIPLLIQELDRVYHAPAAELDAKTHLAPFDQDAIRKFAAKNGSSADPEEMIRDYLYDPTSFSAIHLQPRTSFTFEEIHDMVEPVLQKLADDSQSNPDHTLVDAVLEFLTFFSLEEGEKNKPNRKQHFTRQYLSRWFYDRANDQHLIMQYYLGDPPDAKPRPRLVDTLDRLELVVLNADFDVLGMNLGKKALSDIGDSYGDEPEELWPKYIREKYKGKRPPTLRETIEDLGDLLTFLRDTVGSLPDIKTMDLRNIERRIYNLTQVYDVLTDGLPGNGTPYAGGMKVLRDLFYELHYSTPKPNQGNTADFRNNLSLVAFIAASGLDRQLAFDLRRYDPAMLDGFWGGLVSLAQAPGIHELARELLRDDKNHELIWSLGKALHPMMGNPLPESGARTDALKTKQTMYYGLAAIEQLKLTVPIVNALAQILDGNTAYFASHGAQAVSVLSTDSASRMIRALQTDDLDSGKAALSGEIRSALDEAGLPKAAFELVRAIGDDPGSSQAIEESRSRWAAFSTSDEYKNLQLDQIVRGVLDFFEETTSDPGAKIAAQDLRRYLGNRMQTRDLDQLLLLISHDPAQFENLLDTFTKYVKNGDLKGFFAYLRRILKPIH